MGFSKALNNIYGFDQSRIQNIGEAVELKRAVNVIRSTKTLNGKRVVITKQTTGEIEKIESILNGFSRSINLEFNKLLNEDVRDFYVEKRGKLFKVHTLKGSGFFGRVYFSFKKFLYHNIKSSVYCKSGAEFSYRKRRR